MPKCREWTPNCLECPICKRPLKKKPCGAHMIWFCGQEDKEWHRRLMSKMHLKGGIRHEKVRRRNVRRLHENRST